MRSIEHSNSVNTNYCRGCVSCELDIYLNTNTDIHGDDEDSVKMIENVSFSDKYTGIIVEGGKCEEVTHNHREGQVKTSQHGKYIHVYTLQRINCLLHTS